MKKKAIRSIVLLSTVLVTVFALSGSAQAQRRWFGRGGGVTVFADVNYSGQSATFRGDVPNLVEVGFNDAISSIQIPNGETWQICQDVNFTNRCQLIRGSVSDLRNLNWNDRISSLRRVDNNNANNNQYPNDNRYPNNGAYTRNGDYNDGAGITVFVNPNFRGQSASFRGDTPDLVQYGLNDKITSIEIPSGERWEVCQDVNFGGQCQVLTGSVSDLRSMGWNDRISSMRRIDRGNRARRFNR